MKILIGITLTKLLLYIIPFGRALISVGKIIQFLLLFGFRAVLAAPVSSVALMKSALFILLMLMARNYCIHAK
jgi:hypothetical protein